MPHFSPCVKYENCQARRPPHLDQRCDASESCNHCLEEAPKVIPTWKITPTKDIIDLVLQAAGEHMMRFCMDLGKTPDKISLPVPDTSMGRTTGG
ncbi:hypothetical protein MLD38_003693 [Melastoma candidum]|uniref:Uncharacterized protein n=1 Tax=Melastoma candidum TaxID=119954 RepID=A0ACB9S815_9MYRT|nr:hypothetical protein MLD38_003693 [Melastoma candidum]